MGIVIPPNELTLLECSLEESDANDGVAWSASATYGSGQQVRHKHRVYVSLVDGNRGNDPETSTSGTTATWMPVGATRPWRMLDEYVETQTVGDEGKPLTFAVPFDRATAFGLLNIAGATCTVRVEDDEEGVYLEETIELVRDIGGLSLFDYNYDLIEMETSVVRVDLPLAITGRLHVRLDPGGEGGTAAVGAVVVGRGIDIGKTLYGAKTGVTDYSVKKTNDYGYTTFVRRGAAPYADVTLYHHPSRADFVNGVLTELRSRPALWVLDPRPGGHTSLSIHGWLEDWDTVFEGPNEQELSLTIQGLL